MLSHNPSGLLFNNSVLCVNQNPERILKCTLDEQMRIMDKFGKFIYDNSGTPIVFRREEIEDLRNKQLILLMAQ